MASVRPSRRRRVRRRPARWFALLLLVGLAAATVAWWFPEWRDTVKQARQGWPLSRAAVTPLATPRAQPAPATTHPAPAPTLPPGPPQPAPALSTPTASSPPPTHVVTNLFEAQLALARQGLSPGSLDGQMGSRTRNALRAFQSREGLPCTGELDATTRARLVLDTPPFRQETVSATDLARLLPLGPSWLAKSEQPRLEYETVLELVAERSCSHPEFIRRLNPSLDWNRVFAGTVVRVPDVRRPPVGFKAAAVRIRLADCTLQAFDEQQRLLAHYPCSIGRTAERRPAGELHVAVLVPDPNYTFDPQRFPNTPEARTLDRKLILPPGPNNPVGTVWIGLSQPAYGIHGTPHPETAGRAESLGCFRLANWNVEHLLELSWVGMPVYVEP